MNFLNVVSSNMLIQTQQPAAETRDYEASTFVWEREHFKLKCVTEQLNASLSRD